MIQNAFAVLGYVEILETIAVIVSDCYSHSIASGLDLGLLGYIRESAIAIVPIERVPQRTWRIVEIAFAAVDQVNVHPAVIVIIEEGTAGSRCFRQILLGRFPRRVGPGYAAHGGRNFLEIRRSRERSSQARESAERDASGQAPEKKAAAK